jgi:hypothetical protein
MKKIILLTICLLFSVAVCAAEPPTPRPTPDEEVQKPPEWAAFLNTTKEVKDSKALTAEAKAAVAAKATEVEAGFKAVWTPFEQSVKDMKESTKPIEEALAAIDRHNANPPATPSDLTNRAAVEQYNRDIIPYNREAAQLDNAKAEAIKIVERRQAEIRARGEQQIKTIEQWLQGEDYKQYMKVANGLLKGRITWREGAAWRQLVEASKGYRDPMFDGKDPNGGPDAVDVSTGTATVDTSTGTATRPRTTSSSPNVVDPSGVAPWKPGEREAELQKPSVQPPKKPPTKAPPPPSKQ